MSDARTPDATAEATTPHTRLAWLLRRPLWGRYWHDGA